MSDVRNEKMFDVAPGIWVDRGGAAHIDVPELLKIFQIEDTPRNREEVKDMAEDVVKRLAPETKVFRRNSPHEHN